MTSLDAIAASPAAAADLVPEERRQLTLRCIVALAALAAAPEAHATDAYAPHAAESETLLTVPEVATRLRYAPSCVYELLRQGALAAVRRGRDGEGR